MLKIVFSHICPKDTNLAAGLVDNHLLEMVGVRQQISKLALLGIVPSSRQKKMYIISKLVQKILCFFCVEEPRQCLLEHKLKDHIIDILDFIGCEHRI